MTDFSNKKLNITEILDDDDLEYLLVSYETAALPEQSNVIKSPVIADQTSPSLQIGSNLNLFDLKNTGRHALWVEKNPCVYARVSDKEGNEFEIRKVNNKKQLAYWDSGKGQCCYVSEDKDKKTFQNGSLERIQPSNKLTTNSRW